MRMIMSCCTKYNQYAYMLMLGGWGHALKENGYSEIEFGGIFNS